MKTVGIADVIRSWLQKFDRKITIAFIYGSVARAEALSTSDVDLLVIGDVRLAELAPGLRRAEKTIEREVNPTIYALDEYVQQHRKEDSFVKTVLSDSKIFLKGNEGELEALAR